jgi:hypothetical protein
MSSDAATFLKRTSLHLDRQKLLMKQKAGIKTLPSKSNSYKLQYSSPGVKNNHLLTPVYAYKNECTEIVQRTKLWCFIYNFSMTSFFRFVSKRAIYRLGIIPLEHVSVHVTDFPFVNVHVDELSSARIWQHKLCAKLSANININCRLSIKVYYLICPLRHIRIEIMHGSQND